MRSSTAPSAVASSVRSHMARAVAKAAMKPSSAAKLAPVSASAAPHLTAASTLMMKEFSAAAQAANVLNDGLNINLPELPYEYSALEPVISGEIMSLHHSKHHATYTANFKKAIEAFEYSASQGDAAGCLAQLQPIRFNGGGYVNHAMFWKNLCPVKDTAPPSGKLAEKIASQFGSLENLQNKMSAASAGVQGSGWGWLAFDPSLDMLVIVTTANQDTLTTINPSLVPLLGLDVWEHAYYIDYKNARPDYLKAIWKVVNWKDVADRFEAAQAKA